MLEKRPQTGIWGGLWSFPELEPDSDYINIAQQRFGVSLQPAATLPSLSHAFTHFKLHITPQPFTVTKRASSASEPGTVWLNITDATNAAIPTPVRKILQSLQYRCA